MMNDPETEMLLNARNMNGLAKYNPGAPRTVAQVRRWLDRRYVAMWCRLSELPSDSLKAILLATMRMQDEVCPDFSFLQGVPGEFYQGDAASRRHDLKEICLAVIGRYCMKNKFDNAPGVS